MRVAKKGAFVWALREFIKAALGLSNDTGPNGILKIAVANEAVFKKTCGTGVLLGGTAFFCPLKYAALISLI